MRFENRATEPERDRALPSRRDFIRLATVGCAGLAIPGPRLCSGASVERGCQTSSSF